MCVASDDDTFFGSVDDERNVVVAQTSHSEHSDVVDSGHSEHSDSSEDHSDDVDEPNEDDAEKYLPKFRPGVKAEFVTLRLTEEEVEAQDFAAQHQRINEKLLYYMEVASTPADFAKVHSQWVKHQTLKPQSSNADFLFNSYAEARELWQSSETEESGQPF